MKFEWDEEKNIENIKKHDVSFDETKMAFYDEEALLTYDIIRIISARVANNIERRTYYER